MSGDDLMSRAARARQESRRLEKALAAGPRAWERRPCSAESELDRVLSAAADRAVIEQAKGMLMFQGRCDAERAFQLLVEVSQEKQVKVRDLAAALAANGGRVGVTTLVTCPDPRCRGHKLLWGTYTACPWCGRAVVPVPGPYAV